MISAVIPVSDPIPALIDTLTALVPAVADGLIRDVVIAAHEETGFLSAVTEAGGSALVIAPGERCDLLRAAAQKVKSKQALVLNPGMVPQGDWIASVGDHLSALDEGCAGLLPVVGAPWLTWMARLSGRIDPRIGLLVARDRLGQNGQMRLSVVDALVADRRGRRLKSAAG